MSIDQRAPRSISGYIEGLEDAKYIPTGFCDEIGNSTLEQATSYAETGKFQIYMGVICIISIISTSWFPSTMNRKLNILQCDFEIDQDNMRSLNNIVCICLAMGGIITSLAADNLSRKWTLIVSLLLNSFGIAAVAVSSSFKQFLYFRGLVAFTSSSITAITVTHGSEFILRYFRGSLVMYLQLGWLLGIIASLQFDIVQWRYKIVISTIPSLVAAFLLGFFPDSPRFLLTQGQFEEALFALQEIFSLNTGQPKSNFPIRRLVDGKGAANLRKREVVRQYVPPSLQPKLVCIPILMLSQFIVMFSYCTVTFWFPILSQRLPGLFPVSKNLGIPQDCIVGFDNRIDSDYNSSFKNAKYKNHNESGFLNFEYAENETNCHLDDGQVISQHILLTYVITSLPILIVTLLKIDVYGRKLFLIIAHFLIAALTYVSFFMHTFGKDLLYASFFDSVVTVPIAVSQCLAVELFPTSIRVFGVSIVSAAGTFGLLYAASGGMLIYNLSCIVLLSLCGLFLELTGILITILPDTTGIDLR